MMDLEYRMERVVGRIGDDDLKGTFTTTDRDAFIEFIAERGPENVAREVMELGVRWVLACGESYEYQFYELIDYIIDGRYRDMEDRDFICEGLRALEEDFIELGRDPGDPFYGITIREIE